MGRIRDSKKTIFRGDVLECLVDLPTHASGDFIRVFVCKDDANGGALSCATAGWTRWGEGAYGASGANTVRGAIFYKVAASSNEPPPTITSTDADTWSAVATSYEGISGIGAATAAAGTSRGTGNPYTASSITTTAVNSIVEFLICSDGGVAQVCPPGRLMVGVADDGGSSCAVAYTVQKAIGASTDCQWIANGTADESLVWTIELLDSSSGTIMPGYCNLDCATLVRPLNGQIPYTGDALDTTTEVVNYTQLAGSWDNPLTVLQISNGGATVVDITAAATDATDADTLPVVAVEAVGDVIAFRFGSTPRSMRFDRAGCTAGVAGVFAKEYLAPGGVWKVLPEHYDATSNLTAAVGDHQVVGFTPPTDWTDETFQSLTGRWWRWRLTTLFTTNPTISQIFVSSKIALSFDALGSRSNAGAVPDYDSLNCTPGVTGSIMSGSAYKLAADVDMSTMRLMSTFVWDSPADVLDNSPRAEGGLVFGLMDNTYKCKMWTVAASDQTDTYHQKRGIFTIQVNQSVNTSFDSNSPNLALVNRILLAANCKYGGPNASFNPLINLGTLKIYGGASGTPVTWDEVVRVANGFPCPQIDSITNTAYTLVQLGGAEPLNFQSTGFTCNFPPQASVANKVASLHVDNNVIGFLFDIRAGDTCITGPSVWNTPSPARWEMLATCSASATWGLSGSVTGFNVVLRPVTPITMSFVNCPSCQQNGATLSGSTFTNTMLTCDDPVEVDGCRFTSGGTGHALRITVTGTYNFNSIFSGYGADGTTNAALFNDSGGALTLVVPVGIAFPTVRNGAGASTVLMRPNFTLTISGLVSTYVAVDDDVDVNQSYDAAFTGNKVLTLPYSEAGSTWHVHLRRKGYAPRKVDVVFDGNNISIDGTLILRVNFDGSACYTGTTSSDCQISANDPATDKARVDVQGPVTAQVVYNMWEDASVSPALISSPLDMRFLRDPLGFDLLYMSTDLSLRRWHVGDTNASISGIVSQEDNEVVDEANGTVRVSGTPTYLSKQDVRDSQALALSVGVVPAAGSVDSKLTGIAANTGLVPALV